MIYEATIKSISNNGIPGVYVTFDNDKEGFISLGGLKLKNKHKKLFNSGKVPCALLPNSKLNVKLIRSSNDGFYNDLIMI